MDSFDIIIFKTFLKYKQSNIHNLLIIHKNKILNIINNMLKLGTDTNFIDI